MRTILKSLIVFALLLAVPSAFAADVTIIANQDVPESSIDKPTLEKIYLGKKSQWSNGAAITPVTLKSGPGHDAFLSQMIGKTPSQFNTFWKQAVFTGRGTPPQSFPNAAAMVSFVSSTPGAIGYVPGGTDTGGAKVLTVQ